MAVISVAEVVATAAAAEFAIRMVTVARNIMIVIADVALRLRENLARSIVELVVIIW